jgi:hypothetical protein
MRTRPQAVCDDERLRPRYSDMHPLACRAALLDNLTTAAKTVAKELHCFAGEAVQWMSCPICSALFA